MSVKKEGGIQGGKEGGERKGGGNNRLGDNKQAD